MPSTQNNEWVDSNEGTSLQAALRGVSVELARWWGRKSESLPIFIAYVGSFKERMRDCMGQRRHSVYFDLFVSS